MSAANGSRPAGQNWGEIIGRKSFDAFAAAFTEDAVLEASVLRESGIGAKWGQERLLCDRRHVRDHRVHARDDARVQDLSRMGR
jgi:hypothetical protein